VITLGLAAVVYHLLAGSQLLPPLWTRPRRCADLQPLANKATEQPPSPDEPPRRSRQEIPSASACFRELWRRGEVGYRVGKDPLRHPRIGELQLHRNLLNWPCPGGRHVLMWRAEPDCRSAQALEELRVLSTHQLHDHAAVPLQLVEVSMDFDPSPSVQPFPALTPASVIDGPATVRVSTARG
jgi:hypothetical protein